MRKLMLSLVFFFCLNSASAQSISDEQRVYSFGVVPEPTPDSLAKLWSPILQAISQQAGVQLRFSTAPDIPEFERRLAAGVYDFVYINPYHYTVFHKTSAYEAFAKQANKKTRGILVVAKDSGITSIEQLKEQGIAFPSSADFAASVLPQAYLKKNGIKFDPYYVFSADAVYRAVARGLFSAGGGVAGSLSASGDSISQELRVLWRSHEYTSHAFAVKPTVPTKVLFEVSQAMFDLSGSQSAKKALARIGFDGIVGAKDSDWDDVRRLGWRFLDSLSRSR